MTSDLERELIAGMRQEVAGVALATDVLGQARRRHQRRAVVQRVMCTAGVVGMAGAVAAVMVAGNGEQPGSGTSRPPGAAVDSPHLQLAAAIAASENISFKVKTTAAAQKGDGKTNQPRYEYITDGAFDPATVTGFMRSADGSIDVRLINGVKYSKNLPSSSQYLQFKGTFDRLGDDRVHGELSSSVDSKRLFQALRQTDAKITEVGAARYHFEATTKEDRGVVTFVGDVTLNADKRVATVVYDWTSTSSQGIFVTFKVTLEFSGYGVPVTVERPTDVVLVD